MMRTALRPFLPFALLLVFGACDCSDDDDPITGTDAGRDSGMDSAPPGDGATNVCGDGITRGEELCDDGNTEDGDGCSSDCLSDESCGNGVRDLGAGEQCDDGNTEDGDACRGDCGSDYSCGNGVVDTTAEGAPADEVCDDGNSVNGDGCSADCLSDESCGNGIVDLGAGEVCDDGNTDDGDDCSADCMTSLLCGNGTIDGVEECDDGNTDGGDGCDMSCRIERCGNGMIDAGEDCDDGNTTNGDGCDDDCTFTCSADTDCADAEECNGSETCTNPGTDTSACAAGAMLADGTACNGGAGVCNGGVCAAAGCGDGTVTAPEECDDGNTTAGDGCDNDCTWTCDGAADCDDANACNGAETCTMPGTLMSRCGAGTPLADGAACDRDMMAGTRDICRSMTCVASACGDGFVDSGATPPEMCDDGNTMSGDGCSSTCQMEAAMPPTGFRVTTLRLISPRIVASIPLGGCQDITDNCPRVFGSCAADSVNTLLQNALNPMSAGGDYSLHIVNLFRPLNPAAATTPAELHLNATCMEAPTPDSCAPDPMMPDTIMSTANNMTTGTCYMPIAADVNTRAGTPAAYTPTANTVSGPCFISDEEMLVVDISGIMIPLERARVAATYSGSPPNRLISGIVTGFLSETAAADVTLPSDLMVVGGDSLYSHLQAGNRTVMNSMGATVADGCNVGGGTSEDDADMNGATRGFWFFLNFTSDVITWTGT